MSPVASLWRIFSKYYFNATDHTDFAGPTFTADLLHGEGVYVGADENCSLWVATSPGESDIEVDGLPVVIHYPDGGIGAGSPGVWKASIFVTAAGH